MAASRDSIPARLTSHADREWLNFLAGSSQAFIITGFILLFFFSDGNGVGVLIVGITQAICAYLGWRWLR